MSRLVHTDKAFVDLISSSDEAKRVSAKRHAIRSILAIIPKMPETLEAIECVAKRQLPNLDLSKTVFGIAESFDEKYFQGKDDDTFDWYCSFSQARALSALSHALEENSVESTCDCIYESLHSFTPEQMFIEEIKALIKS
jgi:vacuolar-type H+-ATPase catalytic subunit A/Vma1